jgi:predicted DNA-binding transcriptional regulator YafY
MPTQDWSGRAARLMSLETLLLNYPGRKWRTREIADELGISEDTAARDLKELSRTGRVPLTEEGITAGFTWQVSPESRVPLPPLRLDYAQGAALYAAARLLSQQHDERNDAVRTALIQLINILPEPLRPHLEAIAAQLDQPTTPRGNVSTIFTTLSQGWLLRRVVRVAYDPAHARAYECRFSPYLLEPSGIGYTLYFIGRSDPPGALRTFKLERVHRAELTEEPFEVPTDFDGPALLRRAWGVMYGDAEPTHVKLRFSHFVSKRVRETRWHASEVHTETTEGLVWEADIGDVTEIRPWIRGWGADCEVLEPDPLRKEMEREVKRLMRVYKVPQAAETTAGPDQSLMDDLFGEE